MNNKVIHADCLDIMKTMSYKSIDLIITDPPYGIKEAAGKNTSRVQLATPKDYGTLGWDNSKPTQEYFDEMFRVSKNQIIFGGNYFGLPASSCWVVWDKQNSGDFADAELAWTSFTSAVRIFKYRWNGMLQGDMQHKEVRIHPTQKPVPLFEWLLTKYATPGQTILDPFMGSGSCIIACINLGFNYIGIEKEESHFKDADKRIKSALSQSKLVV